MKAKNTKTRPSKKDQQIHFEQGLAYCSYFKEYLPVEDFNKCKGARFGLQGASRAAQKIANAIYNPRRDTVKDQYWLGYKSGVYIITDTNNLEVVYVGESKSLRRRHFGHVNGSDNGVIESFLGRPMTTEERSRYKVTAVAELNTKAERLELEELLEDQLQPKFNNKWRRKVAKGELEAIQKA